MTMFDGQSPVEKIIWKFAHLGEWAGDDLIISKGSIIPDVLCFCHLTQRWSWDETSGLGVCGGG